MLMTTRRIYVKFEEKYKFIETDLKVMKEIITQL